MTLMRCKLFCLLAGVLLAAALPGCNVLGVAAYKLAGPTKVKPKHELGVVPTLVLVERSRDAVLAMTIDADRLARVISDQLHATGKLTIVSQDELDRLKAARLEDFKDMTMKQIAQSVGAKQVIYVDLREVKVEPTAGSDLFKGNAIAAVRVIDTGSGSVAWPIGSAAGVPVMFETKPIGKAARQSSLTRAATLDGLGDKVSKLFYEWSPENDLPIEE